MCVMYTLHEHALARQLADVWVMVPKRVTVTSSVVFMPELFKRRLILMLSEKIYYSAGNDAVDITKDCFGFLGAIGDEMEVIRHDNVRKDQEAPGGSCLVEGLACDCFDLIRAENWEPIFRDRRKIVRGRAGRDLEHCEERGVASKYSILVDR